MTVIQEQYEFEIAKLTPVERMARSVAMLKWSRDLIARQILESNEHTSPEQLKWLVALRMYQSQPQIKTMIEGMLQSVSDRRVPEHSD